MQITMKDIKENVQSAYFQRGIEYYSQARVLEYKTQLERDDDGDEYTNIIARVRGGGGIVYSQNIDIYLENFEVVIEGN